MSSPFRDSAATQRGEASPTPPVEREHQPEGEPAQHRRRENLRDKRERRTVHHRSTPSLRSKVRPILMQKMRDNTAPAISTIGFPVKENANSLTGSQPIRLAVADH